MPRPPKVRGKGLAIMWKAPAMPPNPGSSAIVRFNEDATVNVYVGGQEIGQGAFTVMAQMAAEALGVPYEWVRVSANPVDTKYSPYEWQTVASRLTWSMGNAVKAAAEEARGKIIDTVAQYWNEDPADLDIKNGVVVSYKSEREQPLQKMVVYGLPNDNFEGWQGGPVVGSGKFMPTYVTGLDPETGQGTRAVVHYTVGAQAVEVEVDTETGQMEVIKIASAYDVGKAINPDLVMTQIEGGAVHGMSSAFEGLRFDAKGRPLNGSFVDYKIATALDAPRDHPRRHRGDAAGGWPVGRARRRRTRDGAHRARHRQRSLRRHRRPLPRFAAFGGEDFHGAAPGRTGVELRVAEVTRNFSHKTIGMKGFHPDCFLYKKDGRRFYVIVQTPIKAPVRSKCTSAASSAGVSFNRLYPTPSDLVACASELQTTGIPSCFATSRMRG